MALHYILDGYNVLMRLPQLGGGSENRLSREEFIRFLEHRRPQGSLRNRVTVIFDGRSDVIGDWRQRRSGTVSVIYTEGETADDKIVRLAERAEQPSQTVVVTDDRELSFRVRQWGIKAISVQEFIRKEPHSKKKRFNEVQDKESLTPEEAERITQELAKRWLDSHSS